MMDKGGNLPKGKSIKKGMKMMMKLDCSRSSHMLAIQPASWGLTWRLNESHNFHRFLFFTYSFLIIEGP
jgi:hypothetical protein